MSDTEVKAKPAPIPKEERERRKQVKARWQMFKRVRQAVQLVLLAVFLFLVWTTTKAGVAKLPVSIFSRFDPLMAFVAMVGSKSVIGYAIGGLITIIATLALARFWCGWICPLGTVLDLYGPRVTPRIPNKLRQVKYFLLFAFVAAALLGSLALLWLDPITILVRPLAETIYPAIARQVGPTKAITKTLATAAPSLANATIKASNNTLKPSVHPLLAVPLIIVLVLNLFARRFWCRYLCPLGAGVAFLSKFAWFKRTVTDKCVQCKACVKECPMNTIREGDYASDPGECVQCLSCFARCPTTAIEERGKTPAGFGYNYDPSRRQVLASLVVGLGGAALLKTDNLKSQYPFQLRPPGATEADFLSKCVRCGQCCKVCPNEALHMSTFEAGIESLWSPLLIPRIGPCDWNCNACGQVCPTQAIPSLSIEEKRKAVIGTAVVNADTCIRCLFCIRDCPVKGAIVKGEVPGKKGTYPIVNPDLCIGCGICEYICPVKGESAIRPVAPGASIKA